MSCYFGSRVRFLACLVFSAFAGAAQATNYTEGADPDLSNAFSAPTNMGVLTLGSNLLTGNANTNTELDYVTFTVPAGHLLSQVLNTQYDSPDETSFMGMQAGSVFTKPATTILASDLLGYVHFGFMPLGGPSTIGTNVLDDMATAAMAQGFTPPLAAGPYSLWIQQTSNVAMSYQFNLVVTAVPEPHSLALIALAVSAIPTLRRRR